MNWARIVENEVHGQNPTHAWSVTHEWIQRVAELNITDNYILCGEYPTAVVGGRLAFPAIAIPVEKEKNFECPNILLEELKALLPRTTRVLVIGWRATEDHFLNLLKTHLKPGVRLHVVAGGLKDAEDARVRICRTLTGPSHASESAEGFTDFILSGKAAIFLLTSMNSSIYRALFSIPVKETAAGCRAAFAPRAT